MNVSRMVYLNNKSYFNASPQCLNNIPYGLQVV